MSANFTPTLHTYKMQGAFRYWVQKVLPLVYDDSLSYYELLNKVVDYLNKMMEDENNLIEDVTSLRDAFVNLQNYVNNYFDNLDLSDIVEQKVNELLDSGALQEMIDNYFADTTEFVHRLDQKVNVYNADTGWVELTLESGVTAFSDSTKPAIRKIGNCVYMRGAIFGLSTNRKTIATLPDWALPSVNVEFPALVSLATTEPFSNGFALISIGSDTGDIVYRSYVGSSAEMLPVWLDNSWLIAGVPEYPEVFSYKGTVPSFHNLPSGGLIGDVYTVTDQGKDYVWTGSAWSLFADSELETLSDTVDDLIDRVDTLSDTVDDMDTEFSGDIDKIKFVVDLTTRENLVRNNPDMPVEAGYELNDEPLPMITPTETILSIPGTGHSWGLPNTGKFFVRVHIRLFYPQPLAPFNGTTIRGAKIHARLVNLNGGLSVNADEVFDLTPPTITVQTGFFFDVSDLTGSSDENTWQLQLYLSDIVPAENGLNYIMAYIAVNGVYDVTGMSEEYVAGYYENHSGALPDSARISALERTVDTLQLDAMPQLTSADVSAIVNNVN